MKKVLISIILSSFILPSVLIAQRDSLRNEFMDAESWFLLEEFADALPIYQRLLKSDPGNDNLNYRIGICLLNDPYQKDQAIKYLVDASDNINPNYKENSFKENTAPPDVLYYLGEAYLVNELLDRAIESFEEFLNIMDREIYDEELVQFQINACKNAKRLRTMPVDLDLHPLDSMINTRYADIRPVISGDGTKLVFVTELPFFDGAFFCQKEGEGWSYPQPITQALGFDADVYPVSLSYDGTEMIMYYDDDYIGNLYYSQYQDGRWNPAKKLGENISTKYWESHASFSRDGNTLFFTSNRKGTHGGLDIYFAPRRPDGGWGEPVNLGPTINSRYNEDTPFISEDGQTLYFSSYGHYNMGGYDVFYSKKNPDGSWGEPVNMGYPINTTDDDLYFQPVNNGYGAYYSLFSNVGRGRHDIYFMDIYSVDNPRMYLVTGHLQTEDGSIDSSRIEIFVVDSQRGDTITYTSPNQETGEFAFNLPQGIYDLHFTGEGYNDLIRPLRITRESAKDGIILEDDFELALVKQEPKVFEGEESDIGLRDTLYTGKPGEVLEVPLRLQKGSTLITRIYQDSVLVSVDTVEVERRRTTLEIDPLPGESRVELEMIDKEGNIHKHSFNVFGEIPELETGEEVEGVDGAEAIKTAGERADGTGTEVPGEGNVRDSKSLMVEQYRQGLIENSDGPLKDYLESLNPEKEGINSVRKLFEHLYNQGDSLPYTQDQVDNLLGNTVGEGNVDLLKQRLIENADGPLSEYLESLDLDMEGILTPEDLIRHLKEVADTQGFSEEDIRNVLVRSLDQPLEVDRIFEELLGKSRGPVKEILEDLDLRKEGIYSLEDLIATLYKKLEEKGYNPRQIRKMLVELFESHSEFIDGLGGSKEKSSGGGKALPVAAGIVIATGLFIFFFLFWRRRKNKDNPTQ